MAMSIGSDPMISPLLPVAPFRAAVRRFRQQGRYVASFPRSHFGFKRYLSRDGPCPNGDRLGSGSCQDLVCDMSPENVIQIDRRRYLTRSTDPITVKSSYMNRRVYMERYPFQTFWFQRGEWIRHFEFLAFGILIPDRMGPISSYLPTASTTIIYGIGWVMSHISCVAPVKGLSGLVGGQMDVHCTQSTSHHYILDVRSTLVSQEYARLIPILSSHLIFEQPTAHTSSDSVSI
ncbi:hypothetical protein F4679DRAFT_181906 [Xylaria curta]|nr:hypothetical protein F4679DRAFT_181906 [Xylaria curta]